MLKALGQVELTEIPVPEIGEDQLLVKTGAATICTSDLNDIRENPFDITLPVVIGHEAAGTIAAVGASVRHFRIGDRVATHPSHACRRCEICRAGLEHVCPNMAHFGINMQGTMAEYFVVRQDRARHLPNSVDFPLASLAEPVSVCLEALTQARLSPASSLVIVGDGPFGVLNAWLAQTLGVGRVVLVGEHDFRLAFARGAMTINIREVENPARAIKAASGGLGYDAAILAVGSREAFVQCMECLKPKGRLVVFSAIPGETPVDLFSLHLKELEILGSCGDQDRFDEAVSILSNPSFAISDLITHRFPLSEYGQALEVASVRHDSAMKVSFVF